MFTNNLKKLEDTARRLMRQKSIPFEGLTPSKLDTVSGVYVIFRKVQGNDLGEPLYVGMTVNINRRLYTNHLMGNKSTARLKKYLVEDERLPHIKDMNDAKDFMKSDCFFKFVPVEDCLQRGLIEAGLTYYFQVPYLSKEN